MSNFQTITEVYETTTTRTISDYDQTETSKPALVQPEPTKPVQRKKVIRKKVDSSKFMTPYIEHSQKMQDLFSSVSFKVLLNWFYYSEVTNLDGLCFECLLDFYSSTLYETKIYLTETEGFSCDF
jgi:hypothetical protein